MVIYYIKKRFQMFNWKFTTQLFPYDKVESAILIQFNNKFYRKNSFTTNLQNWVNFSARSVLSDDFVKIQLLPYSLLR